MKQYINNKPIQIIVVIAIALFVGAFMVFSIQSDDRYDEQTQRLYTSELYGHISDLKDLHRGSYYLEVSMVDQKQQFNSLPIAWEVKEYNIKIGDSVSKQSNSNTISFYKTGNNVKLCEVQLK